MDGCLLKMDDIVGRRIPTIGHRTMRLEEAERQDFSS